jgi:hypothetical protein
MSIQIQLGTPSQNSMGGQSITWSTVATVNGLIDFLSGGQQKQANKFCTNASHLMFCDIGQTIDMEKLYRIYCNSEYYRLLYYNETFGHHAELYLSRMGVDN